MHCLKHVYRVFFQGLVAVTLLLSLFAASAGAAYAAGTTGEDHPGSNKAPTGSVYTLSNQAGGNEVLVFHRAADGSLSFADSFETGGLGSGAGLGSQGALVLNAKSRLLFAVNAGSNDVSVLRVTKQGLKLLDVASSGGEMPISLTNHGDLLYVLNAGGAGSIAGFRVSSGGKLSMIEGSIQPLSNGGSEPGVGPAQIEFSPDGRQLVVTEKMTNLIDVYNVGHDGKAGGPQVFASAGVTPFGFAFTRDSRLVVSEAFGGEPDASALSSYRLSDDGLEVISASVPTTQTAACWVAITGDGRYAYTTNTGSNSVSSYRIGENGDLTLLEPAAGETGGAPIDMAFSRDSRYLYTLDSMSGAISAFRVGHDGGLEKIDFDEGLPAGSVGLAAH